MNPKLRAALMGWLVVELTTCILAFGLFACALAFLDILGAIVLIAGPIGLVGVEWAIAFSLPAIVGVAFLTGKALGYPREVWHEHVAPF